MSAGHSKVQVLPEVSAKLYKRALADPDFQAALREGYKVNRNYKIPYLAGYSKDGKTIYVDKDFPLTKLLPGLLTHEHWEKTAIDVWQLSYWYAHGLATHAEHVVVTEELGMRPAKYELALKPYIADDEDEVDEDSLPPNLDMTPYEAPDEPPSNKRNPFE